MGCQAISIVYIRLQIFRCGLLCAAHSLPRNNATQTAVTFVAVEGKPGNVGICILYYK